MQLAIVEVGELGFSAVTSNRSRELDGVGNRTLPYTANVASLLGLYRENNPRLDVFGNLFQHGGICAIPDCNDQSRTWFVGASWVSAS